MRVGSLCTGYGGLDVAVMQHYGATLAWVSEVESAACKVLAAHHPDVPNLGDLTVIDWTTVEPVDVLTAGYPCQPFSHAGKRKGKDDERHLWPYIATAIGAIRPRHVVLENVYGHVSMGLADVVGDLAGLGYDATWGVLRASDAGAPHGRARVFIHAEPADAGSGPLTRHPERHDGLPIAAERSGGSTPDAGSATVGQLAGESPTQEAGTQTGHRSGDHRGERTTADRRPGSAAPDADGRGHGSEQDTRRVGRLDGPDAGPARQRQRARGESDAGGVEPAADADSAGLQGHADTPRTAQARRRGHALAGADAAADAESHKQRERIERVGERAEPRRSDSVDWGKYSPAIRRWERLTRPAPAPTVPGVNGRPRLSPRFVEWMMGLPDGWVTGHGLSNAQALKMLGNGVVPAQAALALRLLDGAPCR